MTSLELRPSSDKISFIFVTIAAGFSSKASIGIHPSQYRATRFKDISVAPPIKIGGCGFCTGLGKEIIGSKEWGPKKTEVKHLQNTRFNYIEAENTLKKNYQVNLGGQRRSGT